MEMTHVIDASGGPPTDADLRGLIHEAYVLSGFAAPAVAATRLAPPRSVRVVSC